MKSPEGWNAFGALFFLLRGRSYAPQQAAKTTFFAAGNAATVRKKRQDGDFFPINSVIHQEAAELLAAARMTQLAQRLRFDLTDALTRNVELLADFFQRVVRVHVDTE